MSDRLQRLYQGCFRIVCKALNPRQAHDIVWPPKFTHADLATQGRVIRLLRDLDGKPANPWSGWDDLTPEQREKYIKRERERSGRFVTEEVVQQIARENAYRDAGEWR